MLEEGSDEIGSRDEENEDEEKEMNRMDRNFRKRRRAKDVDFMQYSMSAIKRKEEGDSDADGKARGERRVSGMREPS